MITVHEAFKKFRSRLELSTGEQADASRRQKEIRAYMDQKFDIAGDFLSGSYRRWTKTKPLCDVDIFCMLGEKEKHYRHKPPADLLEAVRNALAEKYGEKNVKAQRRSINVVFGVTLDEEEQTNDQVMSFDVVPAFQKGDHFEIPDTDTESGWTETDPRVHYDKALEAQQRCDGEWKGLVRMAKKWNAHHGKPVKPSFLIEVMALELIQPPFGGDYRYELKALFAALADRIDEVWADPAGLGPPVSDGMNATERQNARIELLKASDTAARAIQEERQGRTGDALRIWRNEIFGPLFPLS